MLRDRKLNIAPAIKKQSVCATNGPVYYAATPPAPLNNIPLDQFAAVYPPGKLMGNNKRSLFTEKTPPEKSERDIDKDLSPKWMACVAG